MIRLVCFDWGNVLVSVAEDLAEACARAGVPYREGVLTGAPFTGQDDLGRRFQLAEIDFARFCRELASRTGGAYAAEEIARIHHGWLRAEIPGMDALVRELAEAPGVETALLSNTNAAHWERMRDFPTAAGLDHRGASHLLGSRKPDPAIYRALEERTGYRGGEVLFFDDAEDNVEAARRRGWEAERVDPSGDVAAFVRRELRRRGVLA